MRVAVYGAGPVGALIAARLARGGAEVSMVARGRTLAAIRANGVRVHAQGWDLACRPAVSDDPASLGVQDAVVVAVKTPALAAIATPLTTLLGPDTTVLFIQNGIPWWYFFDHGGASDGHQIARLDPDQRLWTGVGPQRALGGVIYAACDATEPGVVHVETARPRLLVGEPNGTISARAEMLAQHIRGDTLTVDIAPAIRRAIWSKLQMNMCSGLLGCLANAAPKDIYSDPACAAAVLRLVAEVGGIADAYGCATNVDGPAMLQTARSQVHKSSIVQDLAQGRPIEFDSMFGIPQEMGRLAGVATPTLDLLVALVRIRAGQ